MKKIFCIIAVILFCGINLQADEKNMWSYSIGQFDINDTVDSFELRAEYLYSYNIFQNNYELKPFLGVMRNGDDGTYLYSGLRRDTKISKKWYFTPSFAAGYYDRGDSKDLGYNLQFRSQIEFSYELGLSRIGFNLNHISNASMGDTNPGTESATISLIRSF